MTVRTYDPRLTAATNLQTNPAKYFVVHTPRCIYAYDAEDAADALRILGECLPDIDLLDSWAESYEDVVARGEQYRTLPENEQGPAILRDAIGRALSRHVESGHLKRQKPF